MNGKTTSTMSLLHVCLVWMIAWTPALAEGFAPSAASLRQRDASFKTTEMRARIEVEEDLDPHNQWNRRQALSYGSSLALVSSLVVSNAANAGFDSMTQSSPVEESSGNFDCLMDLPPLPSDCCRIFFCRHGQTENNRLRLVQGARVNVPLNDVGRQQGRRVGLALSRADPAPYSSVFCSPLVRARQTAEEAIASGYQGRRDIHLQEMNALMEVDFGPVAEGQKVDDAKPDMAATYSRWSMGNVDYKPVGGGDSGRDVSCLTWPVAWGRYPVLGLSFK
jgi:Histidine phosphatase superfamily (branch 1)